MISAWALVVMGALLAVGFAALAARRVWQADRDAAAGRTSVLVEFGRALVFGIPIAAFVVFFTWFISSPYFTPPHGAIR